MEWISRFNASVYWHISSTYASAERVKVYVPNLAQYECKQMADNTGKNSIAGFELKK